MSNYCSTQVRWGVEGHFNPISHPVYLSPTHRVSICRHTGEPIAEEKNEVFGYWATAKVLDRETTRRYLGPDYVDNCGEITRQQVLEVLTRPMTLTDVRKALGVDPLKRTAGWKEVNERLLELRRENVIVFSSGSSLWRLK